MVWKVRRIVNNNNNNGSIFYYLDVIRWEEYKYCIYFTSISIGTMSQDILPDAGYLSGRASVFGAVTQDTPVFL